MDGSDERKAEMEKGCVSSELVHFEDGINMVKSAFGEKKTQEKSHLSIVSVL